jgi:hypothetical protein
MHHQACGGGGDEVREHLGDLDWSVNKGEVRCDQLAGVAKVSVGDVGELLDSCGIHKEAHC